MEITKEELRKIVNEMIDHLPNGKLLVNTQIHGTAKVDKVKRETKKRCKRMAALADKINLSDIDFVGTRVDLYRDKYSVRFDFGGNKSKCMIFVNDKPA